MTIKRIHDLDNYSPLSQPYFLNFTLFVLVGLDTIPKTGVNISLPHSSSNKTSSVAGLFSFSGLNFKVSGTLKLFLSLYIYFRGLEN